MPDINKTYEARLAKLIKSYQKAIEQVYNSAIVEISLFSTSLNFTNYNPDTEELTYKGTSFKLDEYPSLKLKMDEIMQTMHSDILSATIKAINDAWALSNQKNDAIANDITAGINLSADTHDLVFNPNANALVEFISRSEKGITLSDRVWNLVDPYRFELEAGLADGIGKGKSAASMATDLKRYLKDPDKLFRRVRDENGKLQLSKAAQNYHPGQGVYRSSYQNALRLTGTETNIAYRSADHERWKTQDFTTGIEVKTSNNHPSYDICDEMKGEYPKDFKFVSWHPRCRCYAVPKLMTNEEFSKLEDYNLGLAAKPPEVDSVSTIPDKAKEWIADNAERINGWKNKPYWVKDNKSYVKDLLKTKKPA